jgi:L-alanine-DL-glutamate epimerase-like enolase superfamily enzyme
MAAPGSAPAPDPPGPRVTELRVDAYTVPTDALESDGALQWDATTIVVVETAAGGRTGLGYTYAHRSAAVVIADVLEPLIVGRDALDVTAAWKAMVAAVPALRHIEYFHDHVRIESMLFDGVAELKDGSLAIAPGRPGHGLSLKAADARRYAV